MKRQRRYNRPTGVHSRESESCSTGWDAQRRLPSPISARERRSGGERRRVVSRRGRIAVGILGLWLVGLAALARRELFRPMSERLAMAATRVAPGGTYFAVHQDGEQIGFASTTIDTTEASIVVSDYFVAELPVAGRYQRASATTRIDLSRSLRLRSF